MTAMTCKTMLLTTGLVVAAAAILSGCMGAPAEGANAPIPLTPTSRYSLQVEPGLDRIALAVHETGLSHNQQAALSALANRFAIEQAEVIRVEAPSGNDPIAAQAAWDVRETLVRMGVPVDRLLVAAYEAPNPRAPVLAGFETLRAAVPKCGTEWGNLTRTANNMTSSNFGCAVTANLAAQIENPRDIVMPRDSAPASAERRSVVFENYGAGRQTAARREQLLSDQGVSQAVD